MSKPEWYRNQSELEVLAGQKSGLRWVRLRLEQLRDAEPNDGSSPLYAGLARALGELTAMESELE